MLLHPIDLGIIGAYIVVIMVAGFAMSKLASKNLDSYFLGGNKIPWYVLGHVKSVRGHLAGLPRQTTRTGSTVMASSPSRIGRGRTRHVPR